MRRTKNSNNLIPKLILILIILTPFTWWLTRYKSQHLSQQAKQESESALIASLETSKLNPESVYAFNQNQLENLDKNNLPPLNLDQFKEGILKIPFNSKQILSMSESYTSAQNGINFYSVASPISTTIHFDQSQNQYQIGRSYASLLFPKNPANIPIKSIELSLELLCSNTPDANIQIHQGNWPNIMPANPDEMWNAFQPEIIHNLSFPTNCQTTEIQTIPLGNNYDDLEGTMAKLVFIDSQENSYNKDNSPNSRRHNTTHNSAIILRLN